MLKNRVKRQLSFEWCSCIVDCCTAVNRVRTDPEKSWNQAWVLEGHGNANSWCGKFSM